MAENIRRRKVTCTWSCGEGEILCSNVGFRCQNFYFFICPGLWPWTSPLLSWASASREFLAFLSNKQLFDVDCVQTTEQRKDMNNAFLVQITALNRANYSNWVQLNYFDGCWKLASAKACISYEFLFVWLTVLHLRG